MKAAAKKKVVAAKPVNKLKAKPKNHRAVMASRLEPPDSLEFFPTPPWATRALCELVLGLGPCAPLTCWEPAAGEGHMAEVLREYFDRVHASDVFDYGRGYALGAFVAEKLGLVDDLSRCPFDPDWIITNPPFSVNVRFIIRALKEARAGVAMFLPASWLSGVDRYQQIFGEIAPTTIAHFSERVPLCKGKWDPDGSTATNYIWAVWEKRRGGRSEIVWIPPGQREALTKADDARRFGADKTADMFGDEGEKCTSTK